MYRIRVDLEPSGFDGCTESFRDDFLACKGQRVETRDGRGSVVVASLMNDQNFPSGSGGWAIGNGHTLIEKVVVSVSIGDLSI